MLTPRQQGIYRPLVEKAWQTFCRRNGKDVTNQGEREQWYRETLVQELGVYTTNELKSEADFDKACLTMATVAGDEQEIAYWSKADERRAMWRLNANLKQAGCDMNYARAVARNMGFDQLPLEDMPKEIILKVATAIWLHARRHGVKAELEQNHAAVHGHGRAA